MRVILLAFISWTVLLGLVEGGLPPYPLFGGYVISGVPILLCIPALKGRWTFHLHGVMGFLLAAIEFPWTWPPAFVSAGIAFPPPQLILSRVLAAADNSSSAPSEQYVVQMAFLKGPFRTSRKAERKACNVSSKVRIFLWRKSPFMLRAVCEHEPGLAAAVPWMMPQSIGVLFWHLGTLGIL